MNTLKIDLDDAKDYTDVKARDALLRFLESYLNIGYDDNGEPAERQVEPDRGVAGSNHELTAQIDQLESDLKLARKQRDAAEAKVQQLQVVNKSMAASLQGEASAPVEPKTGPDGLPQHHVEGSPVRDPDGNILWQLEASEGYELTAGQKRARTRAQNKAAKMVKEREEAAAAASMEAQAPAAEDELPPPVDDAVDDLVDLQDGVLEGAQNNLDTTLVDLAVQPTRNETLHVVRRLKTLVGLQGVMKVVKTVADVESFDELAENQYGALVEACEKAIKTAESS